MRLALRRIISFCVLVTVTIPSKLVSIHFNHLCLKESCRLYLHRFPKVMVL